MSVADSTEYKDDASDTMDWQNPDDGGASCTATSHKVDGVSFRIDQRQKQLAAAHVKKGTLVVLLKNQSLCPCGGIGCPWQAVHAFRYAGDDGNGSPKEQGFDLGNNVGEDHWGAVAVKDDGSYQNQTANYHRCQGPDFCEIHWADGSILHFTRH